MLVQRGQIVEVLHGVRMFRAQDFLADPERLLKEWFGFGILAHILVQLGQTIKARGSIGMFWSKNLLSDPERLLKERLGLGIVPNLLEKEPEVIQGIGSFGVLRAPRVLCHFNRPFRNGNRLLIFSLFEQFSHLLVQCVWIIVFGQRCWARENPEAKC